MLILRLSVCLSVYLHLTLNIDLLLKRYIFNWFQKQWVHMNKVLCLLNLVQALADPYFRGLAKLECEPSAQPISKLDFEFEGRKLTKEDVREMIYREVCNYSCSGWILYYSQIGLMIFWKQTDIGVSSTDASGVHWRWRTDSLPIPKVKICIVDFLYFVQLQYTSTIGIYPIYTSLLAVFEFLWWFDCVLHHRVTLYVFNS